MPKSKDTSLVKFSHKQPKVAIVTFTYPKDAVRAYLGLQVIPKEWDVFWALEKKDVYMPIPKGVNVIETSAPRGSHLDSLEFNYECIDLFRSLANRGYDIVMKLDSDTMIFKPDIYTWPIVEAGVDFIYVRRKVTEFPHLLLPLCSGICYAFSKRCLVDFLNDETVRKHWPEFAKNYGYCEDHCIIHFLFYQRLANLMQIEKDRVWYSIINNKVELSDCLLGHYGYDDVGLMYRHANEVLKAYNRPTLKYERLQDYILEMSSYETN